MYCVIPEWLTVGKKVDLINHKQPVKQKKYPGIYKGFLLFTQKLEVVL